MSKCDSDYAHKHGPCGASSVEPVPEVVTTFLEERGAAVLFKLLLSYEEEDTCRMRRRIHVLVCVLVCVLGSTVCQEEEEEEEEEVCSIW